MKWFINISTIDDLRNQYKKLLIKFHPDNNPDNDTTAIMQEINLEYDTLLCQFQNSSDYNFELENELKEILSKVIKIDANISIELVGSWIWVSGDTYPAKKQLKTLGFKWASQKHMWYWGHSTHKHSKAMEMSDIRQKYGSTIYKNNEQHPLQLTKETLYRL